RGAAPLWAPYSGARPDAADRSAAASFRRPRVPRFFDFRLDRVAILARLVSSRRPGVVMDAMEKIVSLCKRRGFIFPSSEIYGGLNGAWDYGPLGVELKRNLKQAWWDDMIAHHDETESIAGAPSSFGMVGLDSALLMNPKVWEASGHVGGFSDPMVDDRETRARYRADQLAVFALEIVAADGGVSVYNEVLFAAPGEVGKTDNAELFEPHRKRVASIQKSNAGKEVRTVAVPNALQDEALRAKVIAPGA